MTATNFGFLTPRQPLDGKHAVVTGGGRGIGAAITRTLLAHGSRVTIVSRDPNLHTFRPGDSLHAVQGDVTDPDALAHALDDARARFGSINILVNNAGQAGSASIRKTDLALWRKMIAVNLDGTFYATRLVIPEMIAANWDAL